MGQTAGLSSDAAHPCWVAQPPIHGCGHHPWVLTGRVWGHGVPTPRTPVPDREAHTELALQPSTGPHLFTVTTDKLQHCAKGLEGARGQHHRTTPTPPPPTPRFPCPPDPLPTEVQVLLAMPLPQLAQLRPLSRARLAQRSVLTGAGRVPHSLHSARRRMGLGREVAAAPAGSACGSGAGTALPLQLQAQKWLSAVVSGNS